MEITATKKDYLIEVNVKFTPRTLHDRRLRFYTQDALEFGQKEFPEDKILGIADESKLSLIISNYQEPYEGTWAFYTGVEQDQILKDIADKFEEKKLNSEIESDTVPKRKRKNKKEIE